MVFSSPVFLFLFLPLVLAIIFLVRREFRNPVLLAASLCFYAWGEGKLVALMLLSVSMNYACGRLIERARQREGATGAANDKPSAAKLALALAVAGNLGLLGFFKYANFFSDQLNALLAPAGVELIRLDPIHLPIGISFFTFQALSYVVDVYRRDAEPQHSIVNIALYISLFPQLIAGPIVRYHNVAGQLIERYMSVPKFARGVRRFIMGLGKKVLIANTLAVAADGIFGAPAGDLSAPTAWLGVVSYTLQIYFDFSGYSDMAIGLGLMLGFEFPENFNYPYISRSIREFWRRWHISLSSWFRDYLYISLGGSRVSTAKVYRNLLVVFFLAGLWHGASWSFVVWGFFHGFFIVIERMGFEKALQRLGRFAGNLYALFVVVVGWVFFRAETITDALLYLKSMFGLGGGGAVVDDTLLGYMTLKLSLALFAGVLLSTPIWPWAVAHYRKLVEKETYAARVYSGVGEVGGYVFLMGMLIISSMLLAAGTYNPFIYFRF